MRGLVSCTGIDYCHMALIETKELALKTARELETKLPAAMEAVDDALVRVSGGMRQSRRGGHRPARQEREVNDEMVDAVDVFVGGRSGPNAKAGDQGARRRALQRFPRVLEGILPYVGARTRGHARS